MVLLAVTGPALLNYLRNYQIRSAVQNLTGDIQAARNRAISRNANLGVAVVVQDNTTYWTHVEDDQTLPRVPVRQPLNMAAPDPVGCWGARQLFDGKFHLPITVITGPATDNDVGRDYVTAELGLPAVNARRNPQALVHLVREAVAAWHPPAAGTAA